MTQKKETEEKWNSVHRKIEINDDHIGEIYKKIEDNSALQESNLRVTRDTLTVLQSCLNKQTVEMKIIPEL